MTDAQVTYFWSLVDKEGDCWNWIGYQTGDSGNGAYGYINLGNPGMFRAHRVAWTLVNGPIPGRLFLDHICHNNACVKPDHLRLATPMQNGENRRGARRDSASGVRGVHWIEAIQKWRAKMNHNNKLVHDKVYATIEEAEAALVAKRLELCTHYSPPSAA